MQQGPLWVAGFADRVSILTGPFRPVQLLDPATNLTLGAVSILTGPFRPVQPARVLAERGFDLVSILTGPFGPVQQVEANYEQVSVTEFQSSPALSGRCNLDMGACNV